MRKWVKAFWSENCPECGDEAEVGVELIKGKVFPELLLEYVYDGDPVRCCDKDCINHKNEGYITVHEDGEAYVNWYSETVDI